MVKVRVITNKVNDYNAKLRVCRHHNTFETTKQKTKIWGHQNLELPKIWVAMSNLK